MKLKQVLSALTAAFLLFAMLPAKNVQASAVTPTDIQTATVNVDGFEFETSFITVSNQSMVPFRFFENAIGAMTEYNQRNNRIQVRTAQYNVVLTIGSRNFTVNGGQRRLAEAPRLVDGIPYIPMDAILRAVDAEVSMVLGSNTVYITYFSNMTGTVRIAGSTTVQPIIQKASDFLNELNAHNRFNSSVAGGGSGTGINGARDRTINIGMTSRELRDSDNARSLMVIPIALDAVAIIVHPNNPISNLTEEQLKGIFTGDITNWNQVGGNNAAIIVQTRETGSGTLSTFTELLGNITVVGTATPHASAGLLNQAVAANVNAIGFNSIGYVDNTVKAVTYNNIAANLETVHSGAYGLSRRLLVLTNGRPVGSTARFVDFLRAQECQERFVLEEGFISIRK
jgi:phosphate transport system substrate-binding protein